MTNPDEIVGAPNPLQGEALEWVIRLTSGAATARDADALQQWRAQSPAHAEALAEAVALRRTLRQAVLELDTQPDDDVRSAVVVPMPLRQRAKAVIGRRALIKGAIAASVAGYMVARPPLGLWPSLAELTADYRTGVGEQRRIALAQGIALQLNTQTSVAVRPAAHERVVELITGEAAVTADAAASQRVVLAAGNGRTSATRASFTVRRNDDGACVTCVDGAVQVEHRGQIVSLAAWQQVTYTEREFGSVIAVDPTVAAAWRDGLLVFHDTPLNLVIEEVNRYRPGKIVLTGSELGGRLVNGVFHVDRVAGIIDQLRQLGVTVTILPGGIVLVS
ncbi:sigma factor regulator VreR [Aliidongia dinghuensis]|uniref:Sigma factor regulator VreR n=1 Tax=Aliidongia dinghuensis TaxID=1867774 RepID=A0A8J2Z0N8_9PROT|nr:FecR domain-containing protein [Aliidongia dinghuensis]GGF47723.1 sigma factor regulator VreR [Aliidongia dinghuensis]